MCTMGMLYMRQQVARVVHRRRNKMQTLREQRTGRPGPYSVHPVQKKPSTKILQKQETRALPSRLRILLRHRRGLVPMQELPQKNRNMRINRPRPEEGFYYISFHKPTHNQTNHTDVANGVQYFQKTLDKNHRAIHSA